MLWSAGAVVGIAAEWVAFDWRDPQLWIPDLLVGWTFIAAGLVAAARHRESRTGLLMVATGFTWFVGNFAALSPGVVASMAATGKFLHRGPLIHLVLSYPHGRISSKPGRAVVAAGYAAAVIPMAWDNEIATLVLAALVVGASAHEYHQGVGRGRRARLVALAAAVGFALAVAGGAAARLALPASEVSYGSLLAYQLVMCAIAAGLFAGLSARFWERADIADLVVELGAAQPRTLRTALARALGDPSLELGYWLPDTESFVDSDGRSLSLPDQAAERTVTLVKRGGGPVAAIVHHPAVLDDPALLEAVTAAAQLAASNARLRAEVRARVAEVEDSRRRILVARDEERRRLEQRLHDGAQRRLERLRQTLASGRHSAGSAATIEHIGKAQTQLERTVEDLRHLGKGLHPRILTEQGLEAAVTDLVEDAPVPVQITVTSGRMPPPVEVAAYFTCAEALANVAKHAGASSASVAVTSTGSAAVVVIEDDGVGGATAEHGSGLRGLADRIGTLGGTLRVEPRAGGGTRIVAEIPLGDDAVL